MFHVKHVNMETLVVCPVCGSSALLPFLPVTDHFLSKQVFFIQTCVTCGFKFINPRPTQHEIVKYYQTNDYISHNAEKSDLISKTYKYARRFAIKSKYGIIKSKIQGTKVLDIGCGTGEFLAYCKHKKLEVFGVEPNENARHFAITNYKLQVWEDLNEFVKMDYHFSCITLWHVLEHVHTLNETLATIKKILSANGVLIIAVPNSNSYDATYYQQYWAAYDVPRHLSHFTTSSFSRLIEKHGFILNAIKPQYLDAFYISLLSEKYKNSQYHYIKAFFLGLWSNLVAIKNKNGTSSLIYILTSKNT